VTDYREDVLLKVAQSLQKEMMEDLRYRMIGKLYDECVDYVQDRHWDVIRGVIGDDELSDLEESLLPEILEKSISFSFIPLEAPESWDVESKRNDMM